MKSSLAFIIFLIFTLKSSHGDIAEGERCIMRDGTTVGVCLKTFECTPVLMQLHAGTLRTNPPTICSLTARTVCCPFSNKQPISNSPVNSTIENRPLRISQKSKLIYKK